MPPHSPADASGGLGIEWPALEREILAHVAGFVADDLQLTQADAGKIGRNGLIEVLKRSSRVKAPSDSKVRAHRSVSTFHVARCTARHGAN